MRNPPARGLRDPRRPIPGRCPRNRETPGVFRFPYDSRRIGNRESGEVDPGFPENLKTGFQTGGFPDSRRVPVAEHLETAVGSEYMLGPAYWEFGMVTVTVLT